MEEFNGYDYLGELVYEFIYDNDIVCDDYVVYFEMKYEHEKEYELCVAKAYFSDIIDGWDDDWWEGQQHIRLIGITPFNSLLKIEPFYKKEED